MWALFALGSGVFNAFWTAQIKLKVQKEGALPFTASIRWGVVLMLAPLALWQWREVSPRWWIFTILSGLCESLGLWTLARGARKDYYSSFALSNLTPLFVFFMAFYFLGEKIDWALGLGVVLVVAGVLWLYYRGHWSWWGLFSSIVLAFSSLFSKMVIGEASPISHACVSFLAGALFCTAASLEPGAGNAVRQIKANVWVNRYLVVGSTLATYCFYQAVYLAPLSRSSPLVRVNMVVGFLLSVFYLKEKQDWKGRALGAILLLAGILLVIWKS
jgi:uncharacterized membrane protein